MMSFSIVFWCVGITFVGTFIYLTVKEWNDPDGLPEAARSLFRTLFGRE